MTSRSIDPILIAGTGHVAQALGRLLAEQGEPVHWVAGRDGGRTRRAASFIGHKVRPVDFAAFPRHCSRLIVAVSDDAISEVAQLLAEVGMEGGIALHTCGSMGREALAPLASMGVACGAIHPLQLVASPEQGLSALHGCAFAIDGDPPALAWAKRIATLLGGTVLDVPMESRPLYHAAAVMAGSYVIALLDAAAVLMKTAGIGQEVALRALAPLIESSVASALGLRPSEALTGPIHRGHLVTLSGHVRALQGVPATVRELYLSAGRHALNIAVGRGLDPDRARLLEKLLQPDETGNGGSYETGS